MEFSILPLLIAALIFFFAALVHGTIGFGFPIVATPLLALFTDIQTAIILTIIPTLLVNVVSIASEGNFFQAFRRHFQLAFLALLGAALGTQILIFANSELFKILLAFAIFVYLLAGKIKFNLSWVSRHPKVSKIGFGLTAGLLGGLTNVMAPVLIIYSLESKYSKQDLIQASNLCFLFGKLTQLFLFSTAGYYSLNELAFSAPMLVAVALALFIGIRVKRKIRTDVFIKLLKGLLFILSLTLILQVII